MARSARSVPIRPRVVIRRTAARTLRRASESDCRDKQEFCMNSIRSIIILLTGAPFLFGANKEMVELQRDVAMLQDQVRTLQRALDEKTSILQTLLQQSLDQANKSN